MRGFHHCNALGYLLPPTYLLVNEGYEGSGESSGRRVLGGARALARFWETGAPQVQWTSSPPLPLRIDRGLVKS
jgi:hypothetical protein